MAVYQPKPCYNATHIIICAYLHRFRYVATAMYPHPVLAVFAPPLAAPFDGLFIGLHNCADDLCVGSVGVHYSLPSLTSFFFNIKHFKCEYHVFLSATRNI
ncbi:MAG: hypothetical protein GFH27_549283n238 [Chloroflexi bacterium AL-W]|nr:hypothetical protein [Chloroflexi bacterium AL-N1]NOK64642.1 hypothetical protein [Chloroflexi bacterium AL-N10]NOK75883.1 hypothetical protein [Chloroflexi bacterium AL-N5]NOK80359.1 hypothetical protein [Chloroflexi bacterium AL-W]NOK86872.1 hypothetical protein [Chloroflexi bacterium AL-N15]